MIPVRVLLATLVVTLLSFAVSLFLGILGVILAARVRGVPPNMTIAYRHVAFPIAGAVAAVVLVSASFMEGRHYHQAKALRRMEDQMHGAH
jgi:Na+/phosphate symporter